MPKKTQLEKVLAQIDSEIEVLIAARERLQRQCAKAPIRRPRAVRTVVPAVAVKGAV